MLKRLTKKLVLPVVVAGVVTLATATAHAKLGDELLVNGMTNDDIQTLQEDLRAFGFLKIDNPTKYFGDATETSLKEFQKAQDIETTGKYDLDTHKEFENFKNTKLKSMIENKELLNFTDNLDLASKGNNVLQLQEKLKQLGYLIIDDCTDYYGQMTKDAVSLLQNTYGLKADGITNARTIDLINDILLGRINKKEVPTRSMPKREGNSNLIKTANSLKGASYSFGSMGPKSFDCSGFTTYVFSKHGVKLPRSTSGQANHGTKVGKSELAEGDLVIFSNTYKKGPSHAGIYIGNGQFIHSSTSRGVVVDNLDSGYYSTKFSYGRRVL